MYYFTVEESLRKYRPERVRYSDVAHGRIDRPEYSSYPCRKTTGGKDGGSHKGKGEMSSVR